MVLLTGREEGTGDGAFCSDGFPRRGEEANHLRELGILRYTIYTSVAVVRQCCCRLHELGKLDLRLIFARDEIVVMGVWVCVLMDGFDQYL